MDIKLDKFQPRDYQIPIMRAIEVDGYRKVFICLPRRSGKDLLCWNLAILQCFKRVGLVLYTLPNFSQAKRVIFEGLTSDGTKFIDYIPPELIANINYSEMKITFINNSILQCVGSDSFSTSIIGSNPIAVFFSEFALCDPQSYAYTRPILAANNGLAVLLTTPRGHNHAYDLMEFARKQSDWFVYYKKTSEIKHIPEEILAQERAQMSPELYAQEYECSFTSAMEGSYYSRYIEAARKENRITDVPYQSDLLVYTAWDIGIKDPCCIIFFNVIESGVIRIIDTYTNNNQGLDHYAQIIKQKPYTYGQHFAPHDIAVREKSDGQTLLAKSRKLGLNFIVLRQASIADGIENVRTHFSRLWIDKTKCTDLIESLLNYKRSWNDQRKQFSDKPAEGWPNHFSDALRYLCQSLPQTQRGMTAEDVQKLRQEALYGNRFNKPWNNII